MQALERLSSKELERLASEKYQRDNEPRLRSASREAGDKDWETASFSELLRRSVDRYSRAKHLSRAAELGIDPEGKSDWVLSGEILDTEVRRNRINELMRE